VALGQILLDFKGSVAQCDILIANAHQTNGAGGPLLFPALDRQQITVAAFLNLFIAWETFLESSLSELMTGSPTTNGTVPTKYVSPLHAEAAREFVIGVRPYFDYGNHEYVKKLVRMFFQNGYPFEPHLSAVFSELSDLRTMRNASAHISSTTQTALESLALRIKGQPQPGISLYQLLTMTDPRSAAGETVFLVYKNKLVVTADLISTG
jgi:hypothetical protein